MKNFFFFLIISMCFISNAFSAQTNKIPEVMLILDASGSMLGSAGTKNKIESAREVFAKVVPALPSDVKTGLTVYGHRSKTDCNDIEILIPSGSDERDKLLAHVNSISPKGMTPLANSVKMVADSLSGRETETTIILVSDGIDTCNIDPCSVVKSLKAKGAKFILHVVGFGVDEKGIQQLSCMAKEGGGSFFAANDIPGLLKAFESMQKEVEVKVEAAKTTTKTVTTGLGKFEIIMPPNSATKSLNALKFIKKADGSAVKNQEKPADSSIHPLMSGEYEIVLGFANPNYKPDTEVSIGIFTLNGGETKTIKLGSMAFNIAPSLEKNPVASIIIVDEETNKPFVKLDHNDNGYYIFKTKPLPEGVYKVQLHYSQSPEPTTVAKNVKIEPGKEAIVTLDSGFQLKQPKSLNVIGWDLVPVEGNPDYSLKAKRRSDNDYPLWHTFPVMSGAYNLFLYDKGMKEPLPAAQGIEIKKGELLNFDTGM